MQVDVQVRGGVCYATQVAGAGETIQASARWGRSRSWLLAAWELKTSRTTFRVGTWARSSDFIKESADHRLEIPSRGKLENRLSNCRIRPVAPQNLEPDTLFHRFWCNIDYRFDQQITSLANVDFATTRLSRMKDATCNKVGAVRRTLVSL